MGGLYDIKTKKPVKFGDEGCSVYASDLLRDFEAFKKEVNGVIYQNKEVKLQEWFRDEEFDFIKEHCKMFSYTKNINKVEDKRTKDGYREVIEYTFKYWDKDYNFKQLKKKRIWITVPIKFNTLLDLLPYLPYTIAMSCGSTVIISNQSEFEYNRDKSVCEHGHDNLMFDYYRKALSDLYLDVCGKYFLYNLRERTVREKVQLLTKKANGRYIFTPKYEVDYMHDIKFVNEQLETPQHWSSPKLLEDGTIELSKEDVENLLKDDIKNNKLYLRYVMKVDFPLYLE